MAVGPALAGLREPDTVLVAVVAHTARKTACQSQQILATPIRSVPVELVFPRATQTEIRAAIRGSTGRVWLHHRAALKEALAGPHRAARVAWPHQVLATRNTAAALAAGLAGLMLAVGAAVLVGPMVLGPMAVLLETRIGLVRAAAVTAMVLLGQMAAQTAAKVARRRTARRAALAELPVVGLGSRAQTGLAAAVAMAI